MFTEDLAAFLSTDDFAVPVIMGAVETTGIVDFADQALLGDEERGEVLGRSRSVLVTTADVVAVDLADGDEITVNGTSYRAGVAEAVEDGAFSRIPLGDVS